MVDEIQLELTVDIAENTDFSNMAASLTLVLWESALWFTIGCAVFMMFLCVRSWLVDRLCSLLRWWAEIRSRWWRLAFSAIVGALFSYFNISAGFLQILMIEEVVREFGVQLASPTDRLRALARKLVQARALRANASNRAPFMNKLKCLVERSGAFDIKDVLERGVVFEKLLDEWFLTLRPNVNNVSRQNLGGRLRSECKTAIGDSVSHGARVAGVLQEVLLARDEIETLRRGGAAVKKRSDVNLADVHFVLTAWATMNDDLRDASERAFAELRVALQSSQALFSAEMTEADVDAWGGVTESLARALDAIDAELRFLEKGATPSRELQAALISTCNLFQHDIEHWAQIADRARSCERALQPDVDAQLCIVCMEAPKSVMLEPCHHLSLCSSCANNVQQCPTCRAEVTNRKIVYFS
jgi:hypothetical protein